MHMVRTEGSRMAWSICNEAGCPEITQTPKCEAHTVQRQAHRDKAKGGVYQTRGHRNFRAVVLHRDPICVICHLAASTDADHYPKDRNQLVLEGLDPNDPDNGRGLCGPCHSRSTAMSQPGGWNQ